MNFVSEQVIEEAMAAFELSEKTEKTVKKTFQENQQMLYTYLFSDSFSFLKDGEKEIFLYLALLVYNHSILLTQTLKLLQKRLLVNMKNETGKNGMTPRVKRSLIN